MGPIVHQAVEMSLKLIVTFVVLAGGAAQAVDLLPGDGRVSDQADVGGEGVGLDVTSSLESWEVVGHGVDPLGSERVVLPRVHNIRDRGADS